ncbi:MAG: J domain-containing protein [Planctomycetota bacterium]
MSQDYYATLGVSRGASEDEIRQAYREMARKHHPDLNPDDAASKAKFQDVQRAFEVLGDEQKRKQYDRFGPGFESMGPGGPGGPWSGGAGSSNGGGFDVNMDDLNDLFGGGGGGGFADLFKQFSGAQTTRRPHGPAGGRGAPPRGADLEHEITIPFATAVTGGEAAIGIEGQAGSSETITVKIPAGIEDGKKIRLRGRGNKSPAGGPDGDLLLLVHVAPHPHFRRRGDRLEVTAPITLAEALAGAKIDVPTPRGEVTLTVPAGVSSGKRLRVKGHGVAATGREPGDLYVELQIVLPDDLTEEERSQLIELLGDTTATPRADLRW